RAGDLEGLEHVTVKCVDRVDHGFGVVGDEQPPGCDLLIGESRAGKRGQKGCNRAGKSWGGHGELLICLTVHSDAIPMRPAGPSRRSDPKRSRRLRRAWYALDEASEHGNVLCYFITLLPWQGASRRCPPPSVCPVIRRRLRGASRPRQNRHRF